MCGIAGIFRLFGEEPVREEELRQMCAVMEHRGPDGEGYFTDGPVGIGHRRLSIVDVDNGHQPMSNETGSLWITYNGEIYNYREIRQQLSGSHRFATECDTESIIHLYEEKGEKSFVELNGIFAFALYDQKEKSLILVRDRFGIKPLYYALGPDGTVVFASEVKAILATGRIRAEVDCESLSEHFTFQNNLGERTLYKGIKLLEPGSILVCKDGKVAKRFYWDISFQEGNEKSETFYAERLRDLFESGVRRQLIGEVPLGSYLSGGMDSGSITAVAAPEVRPFHTFTCGFDTAGVSEQEAHFDERVEAELLAKKLDTQHHELHMFAGDMAGLLPRLVWHLEDFRVGISYQIYAISELISEHATVVLSGVGGDELFAGYPWRYKPILGAPVDEDFFQQYYRLWVRFMDDAEKQSFFSARVNAELGGFSTYDSFVRVMARNDSTDPLHRALYFDTKTFLHGLFVVEDKLSMAHSIETRVPFLDHDLVEFVQEIPASLKLNNGESKYILKRAMAGLLPTETLSRRKQGFTPPAQTWFTEDSFQFLRDLILGERALARDFFQKEALVKILDDQFHGRKNNRFLLWSLICFEWWNRLFIDGDPLPDPEAAEQNSSAGLWAPHG